MKANFRVIGGGPAGASAALGLLAKGMDVTVLEKSRFWTGRVCGAFLSSEARQHLGSLGLIEKALEGGAIPVRHVSLSAPGSAPFRLDLASAG